MDATLGHTNAFRRNLLYEPKCRCQVNLEGFKVAVIDADQVASSIERPQQFFFVMDLAHHVQVVSLCTARKRKQFPLLERGNDQQDGIRVMRARFENLEFIDNEVLT